MRLRIEFESEEEAVEFFRSFSPDFREFEPKLDGRSISLELEERPARLRAIANSVLRLVQLFSEISALLRT